MVVQNDMGNRYSPLTIVVPFTDRTNIRRMRPVLIEVPAREGGLDIDSIADCAQIMTIDHSRIIAIRGKVTDETMRAIDHALKTSLQL